jgi:hypothetical protein
MNRAIRAEIDGGDETLDALSKAQRLIFDINKKLDAMRDGTYFNKAILRSDEIEDTEHLAGRIGAIISLLKDIREAMEDQVKRNYGMSIEQPAPKEIRN